MTTDLIKDAVAMAQSVALAGMKSGQEIGFREGMLRAAEMCLEKSKVHDGYLPPKFHNHAKSGAPPDMIATCGRRDECVNLSYEIREAAKGVK